MIVVEAVRSDPAVPSERRASKRWPMPDLLVALETSEDSSESWMTCALDLGGYGIGLALPRELTPGTPLLATFILDDQTSFSRLPCTVVRQQFGVGAVRFKNWSERERLKLLSYLIKA